MTSNQYFQKWENTTFLNQNYFKKIHLLLLLSLIFFGLNLPAQQVWYNEYSFVGTEHSIYEVNKFNDQSFAIFFKEDENDIYTSIDNSTGALTNTISWGGAADDVVFGGGGVIKVGIDGNDVYAVSLVPSVHNVLFVQWRKTYSLGIPSAWLRGPVRITKLSSGDFIISAKIQASGPFLSQNFAIRIDASGNEIWKRIVAGPGFENSPFEILPSENDQFFIHSIAQLGSLEFGEYIMKIDGDGNTLWQEGPTFGNTIWYYAFDELEPTSDGGLVFLESLTTPSISMKQHKKLNADSTVTWVNPDLSGTIKEMADGRLLLYDLTGDDSSIHYELTVSEINSAGNPENPQSFNITLDNPKYLKPFTILQNSDGSYTLVGITSDNLNPPYTPNKVFALRTDAPAVAGNCEEVEIEGGAGQITISNLSAPNEIVEVYDQHWSQVFRCQGADCGAEQTIIGLSTGIYYVKVQFYDANWSWICQLDNVPVSVTNGTAGGTCEEVEIEGGAGQITISNLSAPNEIVEVYDQHWSQVFRCQGADCGAEQTITGLSTGTHYVKVQFYDADWRWICQLQNVAVEVESGATPSCDDVQISGTNGTMEITGLTAPIEILRIYDMNNSWQRVFECIADCGTAQTVTSLTSQNYMVSLQMYTDQWNWICGKDIEFTFTDAVGFRHSSAELEKMLKENKALSIAPNPASTELQLNLKYLNGKTGSINIFNVFGQEIAEFSKVDFSVPTHRIDVSNYENGIYWMMVKVKGLPLITKRFVVDNLR